jgi:hypothetical protein
MTTDNTTDTTTDTDRTSPEALDAFVSRGLRALERYCAGFAWRGTVKPGDWRVRAQLALDAYDGPSIHHHPLLMEAHRLEAEVEALAKLYMDARDLGLATVAWGHVETLYRIALEARDASDLTRQARADVVALGLLAAYHGARLSSEVESAPR